MKERAPVTDQDVYRSLVDNSLEGFAIIQDGRIVFCNETLTRMSGHTRAETLAMSAEEVTATVHPEDRPWMAEATREILGGGIPSIRRPLRLIRKDGEVRWVEARAAGSGYAGRPALQVSYLDVTDRLAAETSLRRSEERLRTLIEKAPVAVGISREGKMVYGNRAYLRMFGIENNEEITGKPLTDQIAPSFREEVLARALRRAAGEPADSRFETAGMRKDGSQFPCGVDATLLDFGDGPATVAFLTDLTVINEAERKLEDSRSKLRNLAIHLLSAREEERKRVAREVHDDLGQILTALKMDLQWIEKRLAATPNPVREKMREVVDLSDRTISIVQRISSELRPGMLDDLGLAAAVEWLAADFSRRNGIPCSARVEVTEARIGGNSATAIFRIVQEALTNIARHARASRACVELAEEGGALRISVSDDGAGITAQQSAAQSSLGIIGIRERVEGLGGTTSITGQPGHGTTLAIVIPFPSRGALA